jgi:hypothetical protein
MAKKFYINWSNALNEDFSLEKDRSPFKELKVFFEGFVKHYKLIETYQKDPNPKSDTLTITIGLTSIHSLLTAPVSVVIPHFERHGLKFTSKNLIQYDLVFVYVFYCVLHHLGFREVYANPKIWTFINDSFRQLFEQRNITKIDGNRGWFRELWWFIYLSKGHLINEETSEAVHINNIKDIVKFTSDHIKNIIERPSRDGAYRVDVSRTFIDFYIQHYNAGNKINRAHWRRMLILNMAELIASEPSLFMKSGGIFVDEATSLKQYVLYLYDKTK